MDLASVVAKPIAMRRKRVSSSGCPGPAQESDQWLAARILKYEDRPPFVTSKRQRLGCPRGSSSAASEYSCSSRRRV